MRTVLLTLFGLLALPSLHAQADDRLRVIIETDLGGDADDQASFVRFLLYANEWDVEGVIADRPAATFDKDPDADGKNLKRLTEGNKYVEFRLSPKDAHGSTDGPDVSPDGKQIAFIAVKDGVPNVFVVAIDGSNRRQLTAREAPCGRVKWSPDGKLLSFVSFEGKYPQLFVVPAAGGEPRQLTKLDGGVNFAHWKPE